VSSMYVCVCACVCVGEREEERESVHVQVERKTARNVRNAKGGPSQSNIFRAQKPKLGPSSSFPTLRSRRQKYLSNDSFKMKKN